MKHEGKQTLYESVCKEIRSIIETRKDKEAQSLMIESVSQSRRIPLHPFSLSKVVLSTSRFIPTPIR